MGHKRKFGAVNVAKAVFTASILNALEIFVLFALMLLVLFDVFDGSAPYVKAALIAGSALLMINNIIAIRNLRQWSWVNSQNSMLKDSISQVETLNDRLRTQRHDFMNHLQVIYSLVEMEESDSAIKYIEKLHGNMRSRSLTTRTSLTAVNALLQAKLSDCINRNIKVDLKVNALWSALPVEEWEMCRVLGNIIDNAMDALEGKSDAKIDIELFEDINSLGFSISNNGPMIDKANIDHIFNLGFTTKSTGQGLGLNIVKRIMETAGGKISIHSDEKRTCFTGTLPAKPKISEPKES
ncbi:MAG: GHKL domain-containing protein [Clostridiales bacterium]|nr:GHKL domain-containing protein [Clostridiales bacterium]